MGKANWHQYQVLTKRSDRLLELSPALNWRPHIWMGVSVENDQYLYRVDQLRQTGAHIKFLSIEPLLGPLNKLNLRGIDWVIVGGESGPGARPMDAGWVREIRDYCKRAGVPFFFKQWGGVFKKRMGRVLDGRTKCRSTLFCHSAKHRTTLCPSHKSTPQIKTKNAFHDVVSASIEVTDCCVPPTT
jgi:protein gp37